MEFSESSSEYSKLGNPGIKKMKSRNSGLMGKNKFLMTPEEIALDN
jgi:hypothetical protein